MHHVAPRQQLWCAGSQFPVFSASKHTHTHTHTSTLTNTSTHINSLYYDKLTHTHTHIYIYMLVCFECICEYVLHVCCVCVYILCIYTHPHIILCTKTYIFQAHAEHVLYISPHVPFPLFSGEAFHGISCDTH